MSGASRRSFASIGLLAAATVVAAGFALRRPVLEWWWLRRLGSAVTLERYRAAVRLGEMGSKAAAEPIVALLQAVDGDPRHKAAVAAWLERHGELPDPRTPGMALAEMIRGIGPAAAAPLREALRVRPGAGEFPRWRPGACRALGYVGAKGDVPLLMDLMDEEDCRVRLEAYRALGMLGPDATAAIPKLEAVLGKSKNPPQGPAIAEALERIRGRR